MFATETDLLRQYVYKSTLNRLITKSKFNINRLTVANF